MKEIRNILNARETLLHAKAAKSLFSRRERPETPSPVRTEFQRDRDRILHCKSFRRLKHKTQVFIAPEGDHYRTRLTHTLELSQISRTIARALNLNEDLTEAIALGHDLGHTPFGHAGESVLNELSPDGFRHYEQSLRVVEKLEYDGKGLNLTAEVRNGILKHSKGMGPVLPEDRDRLPFTLEGQIVRISDLIAYVNHDLDDAVRAGILSESDIPASNQRILGKKFAKRIDTIVIDVIRETLRDGLDHISLSEDIHQELLSLRMFLFDHVYRQEERRTENEKVRHIMQTLFERIICNPQFSIQPYPEDDSRERRIIDFIAGMTDRFALQTFQRMVLPHYFS